MSVVVLGLSHRSAPLEVLESVALDPTGGAALARATSRAESVSEAVVLSTCNRLEVYAEARTFHGAVVELGEAVAVTSGVPLAKLREHLYVHYEDRAIAHLFTVACGLDSMAVGEGQILGQLREALRFAQEEGHAGGSLGALFQQALRVGKRAHHETGIDSVSVSLVEAGLADAVETVGPLAAASVLVVGAGAMSSLAAATASRLGVRELTVLSRTPVRAARVAEAAGGRVRDMNELASALDEADIVVTCTGALGYVVNLSVLPEAGRDRPLVAVDLALPRDVDPAVGLLRGVRVVDLAALGALLDVQGTSTPHVQAVRDLVVDEVASYLGTRRALAVAPTVTALRSRAADVVATELTRLEQRLPMDQHVRAEVQLAVHRVVEKLLHTPTVRVKELAGDNAGGDYAQALRDLFDLDPQDVAAVSVPPDGGLLP